jgi:Xaa-Pro aminopeptidase
MLTPDTLAAVQSALADTDADGWLLYDFRGLNPIAKSMLRLEGMCSRRVFGWVPTQGTPVAIAHAIEPGTWAQWPAAWERRVYASWKSLAAELAALVGGKRVFMEYSPLDAVPVVDRVPAGVLEMVRAAGATVLSSADLVSRFFAVWTPAQMASHRRAAEHIARIAREAHLRAGAAAHGGSPLHEHELMAWIQGEFAKVGLSTDHGPNVSASENAANPHYEPSPATPRELRVGDVVLIDLWATESGGIFADQTWMSSIGAPSEKVRRVWTVVRDARDAALSLIHQRLAAGAVVRGADADDAARHVIEAAGFGPQFTHRTGHSIDARALHGSGPNLDNLETREERVLIDGVGFSVEPGVYLPGEFGVRSEINAYIADGKMIVTPVEPQRDLMVV